MHVCINWWLFILITPHLLVSSRLHPPSHTFANSSCTTSRPHFLSLLIIFLLRSCLPPSSSLAYSGASIYILLLSLISNPSPSFSRLSLWRQMLQDYTLHVFGYLFHSVLIKARWGLKVSFHVNMSGTVKSAPAYNKQLGFCCSLCLLKRKSSLTNYTVTVRVPAYLGSRHCHYWCSSVTNPCLGFIFLFVCVSRPM